MIMNYAEKMKIVILLPMLMLLSACGDSQECVQAKNRVTVYENGLRELERLYSDDLDSAEAKRRISAMKSRIKNSRNDIASECK